MCILSVRKGKNQSFFLRAANADTPASASIAAGMAAPATPVLGFVVDDAVVEDLVVEADVVVVELLVVDEAVVSASGFISKL